MQTPNCCEFYITDLKGVVWVDLRVWVQCMACQGLGPGSSIRALGVRFWPLEVSSNSKILVEVGRFNASGIDPEL